MKEKGMKPSNPLVWLMTGDVSIQYQTSRDLLESKADVVLALQKRIAQEGFGRDFLALRNPETKYWGEGLYSPKWISTHYTLLEMLGIGIEMNLPEIKESTMILLEEMWRPRGEVKTYRHQDMCVSAMMLQIASNALVSPERIFDIVDYILLHSFPDGGWNCRWENGAKHSSLHTTLSVLESFQDYEKNGFKYRLEDIHQAIPKAVEFILKKHLFRSVHTGEIIDPKMMMLSYPTRWQYDILRALDYLASINYPYDDRMEEALTYILGKKGENNRWNLETARKNLVHFNMEKNGKESRWNTLRILRVLKKYNFQEYLRICPRET